MKEIDIILFDLGGVLVELTGVPTMIEWIGGQYSDDKLWEIWLHSPAVRSFETGGSTAEEFADEIIKEMNLSVERAEFINAFRQWPRGLFPGVLNLISAVKQHYTLACLSNSNELHWPRLMAEMGLDQAFDHHFASHLIGVLKPDPEAFEHVLQNLDCNAASVLFLDDNEINIKGAKEVGMVAHRVKGPEEVGILFKEIGILSSN